MFHGLKDPDSFDFARLFLLLRTTGGKGWGQGIFCPCEKNVSAFVSSIEVHRSPGNKKRDVIELSNPQKFAISGKDIDKKQAVFVCNIRREPENKYVIP
jgi:hypothetical protein